MSQATKKPIMIWLLSIIFLIFLTTFVGGITRLTESGLSIVHWQPIEGVLPPLSNAAWKTAFEHYKQFPEFKVLNSSMTLRQFKSIFFWEYLHRIFARGVGLVILIPYLYFLFKKKLSKKLIIAGAIMTLWVLFQGFIGWFMVKSGLVNNPHVSHFRLATHLLLAFLLAQYVCWILFSTFSKSFKKPTFWGWALFGILITQIIYGAFTAGLDAGYAYNTFPKMNGFWLPPELTNGNISWQSFLDTPAIVQFIHRWLAFIVLFAFIGYGYQAKQSKALFITLSILGLQILIGIATLVTKVNIPLAASHQGVAFLLLTATLYLISHPAHRHS